ncbi:hypothetical protein NORO109296_01645 [Nocardiopsis rhodophaea]
MCGGVTGTSAILRRRTCTTHRTRVMAGQDTSDGFLQNSAESPGQAAEPSPGVLRTPIGATSEHVRQVVRSCGRFCGVLQISEVARIGRSDGLCGLCRFCGRSPTSSVRPSRSLGELNHDGELGVWRPKINNEALRWPEGSERLPPKVIRRGQEWASQSASERNSRKPNRKPIVPNSGGSTRTLTDARDCLQLRASLITIGRYIIRDEEVVGSNPATPTERSRDCSLVTSGHPADNRCRVATFLYRVP